MDVASHAEGLRPAFAAEGMTVGRVTDSVQAGTIERADRRMPAAGAVHGRTDGTPRRFQARLHRDLATIAPRWSRLQATGCCTVYQRFEWVSAMLDHLIEPSSVPLFIEVFEQHSFETLMIWPLVSLRRWGCSVIQWLDLGVCDYAAPVIAPSLSLSAAEGASIWLAVKAALPKADLIDIVRIPRALMGRDNPLADLPGLRPSQFHASAASIDGDPATVLKRICSKSGFRDLSRARNRMDALGGATLHVAETPAAVDRLFDALLAQRRERFQRLGRFDLLARPDVQAFYRAAAMADLATGHVRLFGLRVGDAWVATSYCLVHDGAAHGILLGMSSDETWKRCAPGLLIATENIVWARRQGLSRFDFTIGELAYKSGIGAQGKAIFDLKEVLSFRGAALLAIIQCLATTKRWLVERPVLFGRLKTLRRALRRRLS